MTKTDEASQDYDLLQEADERANIESVITDYKIKIEQHKTNFETLKVRHLQLQDVCDRIKAELAMEKESKNSLQQQFKDAMSHLQAEYDMKVREVEQLKTQVLTPQRLEVLRLQIQEEVGTVSQRQIDEMDKKVEHFRTEYNRSRYEYAFLKSEYEHTRSQHQAITEEMQKKHQIEINDMQKDKDALILQRDDENSMEEKKLRTLQRENSQLQQKVKALQNELVEARSRNENISLQSDQASRLHTRQQSETIAKMKAAEVERESFKLKCQRLQSEIENNRQAQDELHSKLHSLERDKIALQNRNDELEHNQRVAFSDFKLEAMRARGDLEREIDGLQSQLASAKSEIAILLQTKEELETTILSKEQDITSRIQGRLQEEWKRSTVIEQDKLDLEEQLAKSERLRLEMEVDYQAKIENREDEVRSANDMWNACSKENETLKQQIELQQQIYLELEQERSRLHEMKQKYNHMQTQLQTVVSREQEVIATNDKLQSTIEALNEEVKICHQNVQTLQHDASRSIEQHQMNWSEERERLQKKLEEQDVKLAKLHKAYNKLKDVEKKRREKYVGVVRQMKEKIAILKGKKEKYELERQAIQQSAEAELTRLRRQLRDLVRRQNEFKYLVLSSPDPNSLTQINRNDVELQVPQVMDPIVTDLAEQERRHQHELSMVFNRLDNLQHRQSRQLQEFVGDNLDQDLIQDSA